jgi:spoIIIJ-associated protein
MNKYIYEGKTKEDAISKALTELKVTEENLIINVIEEKNGLLKKSVKIEVVNINDLINYAKETIMEIITLMNLTANLEVRRRENNITITIYSNNNSILIGKNGRTISSLQTIIRQIILSQVKSNLQIIIDVENYKEKRIKSLEYLAKKLAKEVAKTKTETKLDPMNSYERRAIHNVLSQNKYVYTESVGTEPNRYIVIKPKEEETN